jgi:nitrate/nitrite transport system permease protein
VSPLIAEILEPPAIAVVESVEPTTPTGRPPAKRQGSRLGTAVSTFGWAMVGFAVLVGLWAAAASRVKGLPTPAATFTELRHLLAHPFINKGPSGKGIGLLILGSLQRVLTGFGIAAVVGVPLGIAMGASKRVWKAANPVIQLLRPVSPLAWFPIWLVAFKNAPHAAVWVIFITALWPIVLNTAAGAASIPKDQRNVAKVFRLKPFAYVRHVMLPHTLPSIVTGLRLSMGVAWMVIVAVEMLSGGVGIGDYVWVAYNALNLAKVISAIVLIGVVGLVLDAAFLRLGKLVSLEEGHA